MAVRFAAFLLAQKVNVWRLVVEEVTDEAFHGEINF
jgi:hypothetical protein